VKRVNEFGQQIGEPVTGWRGAAAPQPLTLSGRYVRLEPLSTVHAQSLFGQVGGDHNEASWTYLPEIRPPDAAGMRDLLAGRIADPQFVSFGIVPADLGQAAGRASYMRIDPAQGSIEIGSIQYGVSLVRTRAATEAMYLLARHAFEELGYRRYEWKCDSLNEPSRSAARRLGFTYEGRFRQAMVYRGRNRDTDWFSITDAEWPRLRMAYDVWLDPANFDRAGTQRQSLSAAISGCR
jgi:RimJ/RimL family protein N-acetyltransferase